MDEYPTKIPLITRVITHLLCGMSHQVESRESLPAQKLRQSLNLQSRCLKLGSFENTMIRYILPLSHHWLASKWVKLATFSFDLWSWEAAIATLRVRVVPLDWKALHPGQPRMRWRNWECSCWACSPGRNLAWSPARHRHKWGLECACQRLPWPTCWWERRLPAFLDRSGHTMFVEFHGPCSLQGTGHWLHMVCLSPYKPSKDVCQSWNQGVVVPVVWHAPSRPLPPAPHRNVPNLPWFDYDKHQR